ncbi:MAG: DUF447 family protein [Vulcanisaeta sp.]
MRNTRCYLKDLGFSSDTYGETIIVFLGGEDGDSIMSLMPMGFKLNDNCELVGRIFKGSFIYNVILEKKISKIPCIVCITRSPQTFYLAIFNKKILIRRFKGVRCPRSYCDACVDGELTMEGVGDDIINVSIRPLSIKINRRVPLVFDRASAAIIEALVWYTKIPYVPCNEVYEILSRLRFYRETVSRASKRGVFLKMINRIFREGVKDAKSSGC